MEIETGHGTTFDHIPAMCLDQIKLEKLQQTKPGAETLAVWFLSFVCQG